MRILVAKYIIKQQAYLWFHSYALRFYHIHLLHNLQIVRFTSTDMSWKCYCEVYFEIFRPMLNTQICVKDTVLLHSMSFTNTLFHHSSNTSNKKMHIAVFIFRCYRLPTGWNSNICNDRTSNNKLKKKKCSKTFA